MMKSAICLLLLTFAALAVTASGQSVLDTVVDTAMSGNDAVTSLRENIRLCYAALASNAEDLQSLESSMIEMMAKVPTDVWERAIDAAGSIPALALDMASTWVKTAAESGAKGLNQIGSLLGQPASIVSSFNRVKMVNAYAQMFTNVITAATSGSI